MIDLSDEEIDRLSHWCVDSVHSYATIRALTLEIRRRRAAETAAASVMAERWSTIVNISSPAADALTDRVTSELAPDQLCVRITELEIECERLRGECNDAADRDAEIYRLRAKLREMANAALEGEQQSAKLREMTGTVTPEQGAEKQATEKQPTKELTPEQLPETRVKQIVRDAILVEQSTWPGRDVWYPEEFAASVAERVVTKLASPKTLSVAGRPKELRCRNCNDLFTGPERNCPSPFAGHAPFNDSGRGGHLFIMESEQPPTPMTPERLQEIALLVTIRAPPRWLRLRL